MVLLKTGYGLALASVLAGCVVQPPVVRPVYAPQPELVYETPPPGVVYVAPTYALPAPGFVWRYNARFGWGWYHPQRGWHRGWR